jgi:hypothetical protein
MDAETILMLAYESANKRTAEAIDVAERTMRLYDAKCVECDLLRESLVELRRERDRLYARFEVNA